MKSAIKNILFPVLSAVLLIVVEKVVEKLLEESGKNRDTVQDPEVSPNAPEQA